MVNNIEWKNHFLFDCMQNITDLVYLKDESLNYILPTKHLENYDL